ncbi:MAG TPA: InlB B-repeat-containing protein [Bacilli bacterium]
MKIKKTLIIILLFLVVFLGGCNKNQYTITFETNGGTEIQEYILDEDEEFTLPDEPIRNGYDFGGWFLDNEFNTPFNPTTKIKNNIVLYAKWNPHEYEITFESNGGSKVASVKVFHDQKLQAPVNPTNGEFIFAGWYVDSALLVPYDFNEPVTRSFKLYAKWDVPLVEEEEYSAYYIVTSPGQDASTSVNINYHIKNTKSKLEYTLATDTNYENKVIVNPVTKGFEALEESLEIPFERRNVCKVTLTNLQPNTKYKYRINQGNNTYSDDYFFTTAGGDDSTSFLFMTDVHYYDGYDGAEINEEVINAALDIQPNLDFVLTTGDMVDTGGNSVDWDKFFTHANSFKKMPYVGVPGNHELYELNKGVNKIFRAYFNFPANGYNEYQGVSYYFVHNDTLFIQLDTNSSYDVSGQLKWLEEVLKNNQSKFIIVGTHAPFFIPENTTDYKPYYIEVMERYGVDLVLAGHYHSHRYETLFQGEKPTSSDLGVTYLNGAGGGIKGIGSADPYDFAKGYIIDVLDDKITIKQINANGVVSKTYEVVNKKLQPKEDATKEELLDSITATPNAENNTITFTWSKKFYKNIKEMVIKEAYRDKREELYVIPTPGYVTHTFDKFYGDLDSLYIFEITFADGTKETKEFKYDLYGGNNLATSDVADSYALITFDPPKEAYNKIITEYEVYLNGTLHTTIKAKENQQLVTNALITDLESKTEYTLTLKAYGRNGFLYSDEVTFTTK